jgi:alcohol dehydrogenase
MASFPRPKVGPGEGLLLVEAAGVCGSDPGMYRSNRNLPRILGHEIIGRIEEMGEEAAFRWKVKPGDRVAVEASISCGVCEDCLEGWFQSCQAGVGYGTRVSSDKPPHLWGGFAQLMFMAPGSVITKIPEGISPEVAAAWVSPLSNGVEWTAAGGVKIGDAVAILGPGPQGLSCCIAARERGARLIVITGLARDRTRLQAALKLGADRAVNVEGESVADVVRELTDGAMADVVMDVSGSAAAARSTIDLVKRHGTIVLGGIAAGEIPFPLIDLVHKQVRVQGVLSNRGRSVRDALGIIASGKYDFGPLITHRFQLEDTERAIKLVAGEITGENSIKAVVYPNGLEAGG